MTDVSLKQRREFVRVGVLFESDGFRPVWFALGNRKIKVSETHYSWQEREADDLFYFFTVSDGAYFYNLRLSTRKMRWSAAKLD